jgi:hypothetical protein
MPTAAETRVISQNMAEVYERLIRTRDADA